MIGDFVEGRTGIGEFLIFLEVKSWKNKTKTERHNMTSGKKEREKRTKIQC